MQVDPSAPTAKRRKRRFSTVPVDISQAPNYLEFGSDEDNDARFSDTSSDEDEEDDEANRDALREEHLCPDWVAENDAFLAALETEIGDF